MKESIVDSVKRYFKSKENNDSVGKSPEGICPNCWGSQEWEGQFYELMRAKDVNPLHDNYNNFIKEFVTQHISGIILDEHTYTCVTCQIKYD
ncbi:MULTISPECIES: hypothetical protein [Galbibacter]|uniref:hypothetical protein n=1 Tax=Galbibacter orientalis TaxID=453852 RepID=UPI00300280EE